MIAAVLLALALAAPAMAQSIQQVRSSGTAALQALFVPYSGAGKNLDLGAHKVIARDLETSGPGPSRLWLTAGLPPADTAIEGRVYDAVAYIDLDNVLKVLTSAGQIYALTMRQQ